MVNAFEIDADGNAYHWSVPMFRGVRESDLCAYLLRPISLTDVIQARERQAHQALSPAQYAAWRRHALLTGHSTEPVEKNTSVWVYQTSPRGRIRYAIKSVFPLRFTDATLRALVDEYTHDVGGTVEDVSHKGSFVSFIRVGVDITGLGVREATSLREAMVEVAAAKGIVMLALRE